MVRSYPNLPGYPKFTKLLASSQIRFLTRVPFLSRTETRDGESSGCTSLQGRSTTHAFSSQEFIPMWQFVTPSRKRIRARHISARRTRLYRPQCTPLEDRCLLSVVLSGSEPPVPLVGSPVIWTATASGHGPTPVYQFRVGPIGGPFQVVRDFSASNSFTWNPMQEGTYSIQVIVKDSFSAATGESATASYTADSRVVGASAVVSPTSNPLVALYSATSLLRQFDVRPVQADWAPTSPGVDRPAAHRAGGEHQLPRGGYAAQHDVPHEACPGRWDNLRPFDVHDRCPAHEPDVPHFHGTAGACPRN